jgi:hypothetical protein
MSRLLRITFVISALLASSAALAQGYPVGLFPACGQGYLSDAFGLGVEEAITGTVVSPKAPNEQCHELGVEYGKQQLAQSGDADECASDFAEGHEQGLAVSEDSAGSGCYVAGYQAGEAELDNGARWDNGSVSEECQSAYDRGYREGEHLVSRVDTTDQPEEQCYGIGYYDGSMHLLGKR